MGETSSCVAKINIQKRKNVFEISTSVAKKQKVNPTHKTTPSRSRTKQERIICCMHVYTSETALNKATVLKSIRDTVKSKFKTDS